MELMAAIYEQALKRRDLSGTSPPSKVADATKGSKGSGKEVDGGADVGRVMNLMSADATKVSNWPAGAYFLYSAPFEIGIALTFLYQCVECFSNAVSFKDSLERPG